MKEQTRLHIMNGVLERDWVVAEAAQILGVSERHTWRLLAAYRKEGAAAFAHGNRGRLASNATSPVVRSKVITLAGERYRGVNHTHFTDLLAEREGIQLSRSTVRRLLVGAGLASSRHRRPRHATAAGGSACLRRGCWYRLMAATTNGWEKTALG
jgi:transposase